MKYNWEYKPFGKILKTITPTSKIEKSEYQTRGLYPIISQEDVFISGFWDNSDDITQHSTPVVIFGDHSRVLKYIDFEFVVGADGVKIIQPIGSLNAKFLYHFLKWHNVPSLGYSRHFKLLKEVNYPVPPMGVQEQIVAELDQINDLIAKNRELLSQLDALAQSLFYDTFGDPIANPKGWKTKSLANVCTVTSSNRIFANEYCESGIPFYRGKEVSELSRGEKISVELFISRERYDKLRAFNNVPQIDDILITAVGTIGNIWVVDTSTPFYFKDGNIIWLKDIDFSVSNSMYFRFLLFRLIDIEKNKMANGSAYKALTIQNLKRLTILLPPLALQEDFAVKVEAIEAQKAKVEAEIAELQTLLDARMDYWFN